jgi:hypothetical protein
MDLECNSIYEHVNKSKTTLSSYVDNYNNVWLASGDISENCVSIYLYTDEQWNKIQNIFYTDEYFGNKVLFYETDGVLNLIVGSHKCLYFYIFRDGNFEYMDKYLCDENIVDFKQFCKKKFILIKTTQCFYKYDIKEKNCNLLNLKICDKYDCIHDEKFYICTGDNEKINIYIGDELDDLKLYKTYDVKSYHEIKLFINENKIFLAICDKLNLKIYDICSEKKLYCTLYHNDNDIINISIITCVSGRCYIILKDLKNKLNIFENFEEKIILIEHIGNENKFDYLAFFDKTGNFVTIIENLCMETHKSKKKEKKTTGCKLNAVISLVQDNSCKQHKLFFYN